MSLRNRIAWFLRMKDIFRFPRSFLAPTKSRFRRPRTPTADISGGLLPIIRGTKQNIAATQSLSAAGIASAGAGRPHRTPSMYSSADRERLPSAFSEAVRSSRGNIAPALYARPIRRPSANASPPGPRPFVNGGYPAATAPEVRFRKMTGAAALSKKQLKGQRLYATAYGSLASQRTGFPARTFAQTQIAFAKSVAPPPGTASADSASSASDIAEPKEGERQHAPKGADRDGKAASRTTLHIDGHALGRWTVQHLERVLGRPSAGMTGVDPRASTPRSRVSPF